MQTFAHVTMEHRVTLKMVHALVRLGGKEPIVMCHAQVERTVLDAFHAVVKMEVHVIECLVHVSVRLDILGRRK